MASRWATQDLLQLAAHLEPSALPAGGVEFFEAWLMAQGRRPGPIDTERLVGRRLFACRVAWQSERADAVEQRQFIGDSRRSIDPARSFLSERRRST